jgi:hypothetical protein
MKEVAFSPKPEERIVKVIRDALSIDMESLEYARLVSIHMVKVFSVFGLTTSTYCAG